MACAKTLQLPPPVPQTKVSWRSLLTSQYSPQPLRIKVQSCVLGFTAWPSYPLMRKEQALLLLDVKEVAAKAIESTATMIPQWLWLQI